MTVIVSNRQVEIPALFTAQWNFFNIITLKMMGTRAIPS